LNLSFFCGRLLSRSNDPRNRLTDRDNGPLDLLYAGEHSISGRFDFDDRFIGFDFEKGLTLGDFVAFLL
jgi:hypothetical protein